MECSFDIIEYLSGLTTFVLDEAVLKRIAIDRGVYGCQLPEKLDQRLKDLLLADILYAIVLGPSNIPSLQYQHGQFSTSTGSQKIEDKEELYRTMLRLYQKWGDEKADLIPTSSMQWLDF